VEKINYDEFDKEVVELCKAMNKIPGIQTIDSCCGHGKDYFRIFFTVEDIETLNHFMWAGCYRWWNWRNGFRVQICDGDVNRDLGILKLQLESYEIGEDAYKEVYKMTEGINNFIEEWMKKEKKK